jgi:hypothetical protein
VSTKELKRAAGEALAAGSDNAEGLLAKWALARLEELTVEDAWDAYQVAAKKDKPAAYEAVKVAMRKEREK